MQVNNSIKPKPSNKVFFPNVNILKHQTIKETDLHPNWFKISSKAQREENSEFTEPLSPAVYLDVAGVP